MPSFLLFLLLASPQIVTGNLLTAAAFPPKMVPIRVHVDFGPAGKPAIEKEITVREGITPRDALKQVCKIMTGAACCDSKEVKGIDGVSVDPMQNRWWRLKINGTSKKASPYKSRLRAGDVMEWSYFEDKQ